ATKLRLRVAKRRVTPRADGDLRALFREPQRDGLSDAPAAADHHRRLALQAKVHMCSCGTLAAMRLPTLSIGTLILFVLLTPTVPVAQQRDQQTAAARTAPAFTAAQAALGA